MKRNWSKPEERKKGNKLSLGMNEISIITFSGVGKKGERVGESGEKGERVVDSGEERGRKGREWGIVEKRVGNSGEESGG